MDDHKSKFGVNLSNFSTTQIVDLGVLADELGYRSVWIPDHLSDLPPGGDKVDPWTLLAAIGTRSKKIRLLPAVTDPIRIHPAKIANILATLDELSGGRAELAIGAGEVMNVSRYGLAWENNPEKRRKKLREAIVVIKGLLEATRDEPFSFDGEFYKLEKARIDQRPLHKLKVYVGALGGKETLKIIGELGDGWFPVPNTLKSFAGRVSIIDGSAKIHGRDPNEIEKVHYAFTLINRGKENEKKVNNALKFILFPLMSKKLIKEMVERGLVAEDLLHKNSQLSYQYLDPTEEGVKAAMALVQRIPDDIVLRYLMTGTPAQIREQAEAFVKAGAQEIALYDTFSMLVSASAKDCAEYLRQFSKVIKD